MPLRGGSKKKPHKSAFSSGPNNPLVVFSTVPYMQHKMAGNLQNISRKGTPAL